MKHKWHEYEPIFCFYTFSVFGFGGFCVFSELFGKELSGYNKSKKIIPNKYIISAETSLKSFPSARTFRVRGYNYNFKEYFPKEYSSELFPLVFNYSGLILVNENKQEVGAEIISFEYAIVKANVIIYKGFAEQGNLNHSIKAISKMIVGSCVWIKNLTYKDKNGVVHNNKIGEFKIEKVK